MNRNPSPLIPALVLAVLTLIAAALAKVAPQSSWLVLAGPALMAGGLLAVDAWRRRGWPAVGVVVMAAAIPVACGVVGARDAAAVAGLIPFFACFGAVALVLEERTGRWACRRV